MNLTELAAGLGISRQAASKLKKRGMPTGTVAQAQAWRRRNTRTGPPALRSADLAPEQALDALPDEDAPLPDDSQSLREQLAVIGRVRRAAVRRYEEALAAGEDDSARRWAQVVLSVSQRGADAEVKLRRALTVEGETIAYRDAEALFCRLLKEIRGHLDSMPASLAGKVNPGDTAHAQQILSDWRDMVCRALHAAPDIARTEAQAAA